MEHNILLQGEALQREKFFSPSREFGIMPFWFWNGEMDYAEMEFQLREYYDKGIPAIYIHSRFGINDHVPYISEDWFDRVRFTVEKAQEIGLQVWVYDEYNWPSGTCGQSIQKDDPNLTSRYLEVIEDNIPGQYFTFMEGTDSRYHDLEQSEPVYACAILQKDLDEGNPNFINLMPNISFDKVISWEAPPGPWKLFFFIERKASWYADVLNPETTQEFLRRTHDRYKESVAKTGTGSFGSKIRGFYTDEPAMFYFEIFKNNKCLPWSSQMFKIFKEKNGYNLKPHLPMLYYNIGPKTEKVRYDFFSALSDQYEETYYEAIEGWCDENDVVSTGHLLVEESIRLHARSGGNLFHMLRHFHLTGVDHLYPRVGTREMPSEHVALKIASSAQHQNGSTRLLCESMGGLYWDTTMERMKWIADWEFVLGVNILNPHGFHYSIEGARKRDWPPSQFYHHTWWPEYKDFNSYLSRLAYILTGGHHVAKLAVLYPINTVWATYEPQAPTAIGDLIEREFPWLTDRLMRAHVDFDYLDEDVFAGATIEDGAICIGGERHETLLLPCCTHIKAKTLDLLEEFVAAGGTLVADTLLPQMCISGEAPNFTQRVIDLFGEDPTSVRKAFEKGEAAGVELVQKQHGTGRTAFIKGAGFEALGDEDLFTEIIHGLVEIELAIDSNEIFYLHRVKDGEDFWFFINPTGEAIDAEVRFVGELAPEQWDPETGYINPMALYKVGGGETAVKLRFEPFGSHLLRTAPYAGQPHMESADFTVLGIEDGEIYGYGGEGKTIEVPSTWSFSTDKPNVLSTDKWHMQYAANVAGDAAQIAADVCDTGYDFTGWNDFVMGAWEMQLEEERDDETYPVDLWYVTKFTAEYLPEDLHLLIDGFAGESYRLFVNGTEITGPFERSWLDAEILSAPIRAAAQEGENTVAVLLRVRKKSDGMLDLLKICGTFRVDQRTDGDVMVAPSLEIRTGNWVTQGFPYFSGRGTYGGSFTLPMECEHWRVLLKADVGHDILLADVNGRQAGKCLWKPYTIDLTGTVKAGENKLELTVVNTLINLLEAHTQASGLQNITIEAYPQIRRPATGV